MSQLCAYDDGSIITLSQGHTHYKVFGSSGPWYVLVHGFSMNGAAWNPLPQEMVERFKCRVLVYDYYGRGYSAKPSAPQTVGFFDRQLWELVDRICGDDARVTLMGLSMGSAIATVAASTTPRRVNGLIALVPPGMKLMPLEFMVKVMRAPFLGYLLTWACANSVVKGRIQRRETKDFHVQPVNGAVIDTYMRMMSRTYADGQFVFTARDTLRYYDAIHNLRPYAKVVGRSSFPVDVINAQHDNICPPSEEAWKEDVPRAKTHWVPTGHMCTWEDYPKVRDLLFTILARQQQCNS